MKVHAFPARLAWKMHPSALSPSPYDHRRWTARISICGKIGGRPVLGNTRGVILKAGNGAHDRKNQAFP